MFDMFGDRKEMNEEVPQGSDLVPPTMPDVVSPMPDVTTVQNGEGVISDEQAGSPEQTKTQFEETATLGLNSDTDENPGDMPSEMNTAVTPDAEKNEPSKPGENDFGVGDKEHADDSSKQEVSQGMPDLDKIISRIEAERDSEVQKIKDEADKKIAALTNPDVRVALGLLEKYSSPAMDTDAKADPSSQL